MESLVLGRWPIASSKDWGGGVEPFVREGGVDAPPPVYFAQTGPRRHRRMTLNCVG
jgi:hypothetical protein